MSHCSLSSSAALCVALVSLALSPGQVDAQSRWQDDAPGRTHRIDVAGLPAPFATPSARDFPAIVAKPGDASLKLPPGFKIDVFTRDGTYAGIRGRRERPDMFADKDANCSEGGELQNAA